MANEIEYSNPSVTAGGLTNLYAIITQSGQCVLTANGALAAINATNWPNAAIALADSANSAYYFGNWPSGVAAGVYSVQIRQKAGGSAALSDTVLASINGVVWTGTGVGPKINASGYAQVSTNQINDAGPVNQVGSLNGVNITAVSFVYANSVTIYEKDAYLTADGRQIPFNKPTGASWPPNLTGWAITFTATKTAQNTSTGTTTLTTSGTVTIATGDAQQVTVDLTSTQTTGLAPGMGNKGYVFDIVATNGTDRATLVSGLMSVVANVTA